MVYLGLYDPPNAPGVVKKIAGTLKAAEAAGYTTRAWSEPFHGVRSLAHAFQEVARSRETHIILRSLGWANLFLVPVLCVARLRRQYVVVEVPTPHRVGVREVWSSSQSAWRRIRSVALFYASGPWSLWPASRIVQYADEGWWFRLGNVRRTAKIGNGVDVQRTPQRGRAPAWPAPVLQLVGVATLMSWHGYDRLIRAVAEFQADSSRPFDVHFTIVGDGPALDELTRLTQQLGVQVSVAFAGALGGDEVYPYYDRAHLAVSALAIHRKGLREASALKAREYCVVGIPFIASGHDPDFGDEAPFRIEVSLDEDNASLIAAFTTFGRRRPTFSDDDIRRYAVERLDFTRKLAGIIP